MSANKRTGTNSCVKILLQFYLGTCTFSFFQVTKQSIYMQFTPWRGYPQLAQADEREVKPHMLTTYCSSLAALSPKGSAVEGQCTAKQTLLLLQHALPLSAELPCRPLDPSPCQPHLLTQHSTSLTKWIALCQVIKPNCWSKASASAKVNRLGRCGGGKAPGLLAKGNSGAERKGTTPPGFCTMRSPQPYHQLYFQSPPQTAPTLPLWKDACHCPYLHIPWVNIWHEQFQQICICINPR